MMELRAPREARLPCSTPPPASQLRDPAARGRLAFTLRPPPRLAPPLTRGRPHRGLAE